MCVKFSVRDYLRSLHRFFGFAVIECLGFITERTVFWVRQSPALMTGLRRYVDGANRVRKSFPYMDERFCHSGPRVPVSATNVNCKHRASKRCAQEAQMRRCSHH